jgi:hypothetical protein
MLLLRVDTCVATPNYAEQDLTQSGQTDAQQKLSSRATTTASTFVEARDCLPNRCDTKASGNPLSTTATETRLTPIAGRRLVSAIRDHRPHDVGNQLEGRATETTGMSFTSEADMLGFVWAGYFC